MKLGMSAPLGGAELLPGRVVHFAPQAGGFVVVAAKPLNDAGAAPPLSRLSADHVLDHHVTVVVGVAVAAALSPRTNAPWSRNPNTVAVLLVSDDGR